MKRILAISLLLIPLLLSGCTEEGPVASSSGPVAESSSSEISSSEEIDDVDYSIVTESEYGYLTLPKESYGFATIKENDNYPPAAEVEIACDWNYVTFLNENYTKILIENEAAVPSSAVSYSTRDSLSGTGGSSEIEAIVLTFDRSLIQPGTTRIRFETRPGNGVSTTKVFAVCFEVKVYPYGGIEVPTYDVNLKVDLSWLNDLMPEIEGATALTFTLSDSEEIYGYSADGLLIEGLPLEGPFGSLEFAGIKWAAGHVYEAWLFIDNEDFSARRWYPIKEASPSSDYTITVNPTGDSTIEVEGDCTIEAVLFEGV